MTVKKDYIQHRADFNIAQLEQEIFIGTHNAMNAYVECCGRHADSDRADKLALVHEDTQGKVSKLTYAELDAMSGKIANLLTHLGVQAGDRVSTMLPRTPQLLAIILGTWRIGAVYQPLFTAFGVESIAYRLDKADTKVVFTNHDNRSKFTEINNLPTMIMVGSEAEAEEYTDQHFESKFNAQSPDFEPVLLTRDAPFLQMFTSGTVGKSKGVSIPLNALTAFYIYMQEAIGLSTADNYWNMADPGWAYGLYYAITGPLMMGATTHFNECGFDAKQTFDFIKNHNITNLASSPTAYRMMKSSGVFDNKANELTALTKANSAGETLNTEVVNWVNENLGCPIMDQYGQTETGMTCCAHHCLEHATPVGSMGMPMSGHNLAVLDENFNEVPNGTSGQLAVVVSTSPAFYFTGYTWNEKNAFHGDYYLTGDVVEKHDDGTYWFSGRDDDIIISAGYRIGPTDVENVCMEHDAVAEVAVVGVPEETRGHIVKAFIVLKEGQKGSDEIAQQIKTLVRERLSTHAFPREIEFVESFPKTPSGKVQRFMLRNRHKESK